MSTHKNILIIGTSHIAKTSVEQVKKNFLSFKPDIICVELDSGRLQALLSKEKSKITLSAIKHIGVTGYLFALLAQFVQKKLGNVVGVSPGSEMKMALKLAKINHVRVALIDQDITITLRRLSKYFTFKEKLRIAQDIVLGPFSKKRRELVGMNFDLSKVPEKELIKKLILMMKNRYPNLHNVLIHERNIVMAKRIRRLSDDNPDKNIMVVIGAGHEEEMLKMIKKEEKTKR